MVNSIGQVGNALSYEDLIPNGFSYSQAQLVTGYRGLQSPVLRFESGRRLQELMGVALNLA